MSHRMLTRRSLRKLNLGLLACLALSAGCSDDTTPFELGRPQASVGVETSSVAMEFLVDGQPAAEVPLGGSYAVRAIVSGPGAIPTGTVTIRLYGNGDCTGTIFGEYVQPVNADGIAQLPFTYPANSLGTAYFQGTYSGDDVYAGAISICAPVSVVEEPSPGKQTPVIIVTVHDGSHQTINNVAPSTPVHPQVSVIGNGSVPTGLVGFRLYGNGTCSGFPNSFSSPYQLDANGEADATASASLPIINGSYSFQAYYEGDDAYEEGYGCISFTVSGLPPRLTPDISLEVHNTAHQEVATIATDAEHHPRATVTGTGPAPTGIVEFNYYHDGTCTGVSKGMVWIELDGSGDADAGTWGTLGFVPGTHSWSVTYPGDGAYEAGQRCVAFNVVQETPPAPVVKLGGVGYWRNWSRRYTQEQLQTMIDQVKANNAGVFNADQATGTGDDLTVAKLNVIFDFGKKPPTEQHVLAHLTALTLDLALTQLAAGSGLVQPNSSICTTGETDVSGIAGAAALLGTSSPTVGQIVGFVEQRWTGDLTAMRHDWSFSLTQKQLTVVLKTLSGINDGTIITSTGC